MTKVATQSCVRHSRRYFTGLLQAFVQFPDNHLTANGNSFLDIRCTGFTHCGDVGYFYCKDYYFPGHWLFKFFTEFQRGDQIDAMRCAGIKRFVQCFRTGAKYISCLLLAGPYGIDNNRPIVFGE